VSIVFRTYLEPRVSAHINDNEKFNYLSFIQGTPCQSSNDNIFVYGSKNDACTITNILIVSNFIYYENSGHKVIYTNNCNILSIMKAMD
jgi:hypothetical protein